MHNFRELNVWRKSVDLVTKVYQYTVDFPDYEKFRLLQQVCGASVSIPSNIAEGAGRGTNKDFSNFLNYSLGSSFELETQWIVAKNLGYIDEKQFSVIVTELNEIQAMIIKLKRKLI